MKKQAILFIDGNNLYHNLKQLGIKPGNLDFVKFVNLICDNFNCKVNEVRYYNSLPSMRDGKLIYFSHLKFIDDLRKIPNFKIFTRKLQVHSNKEILKERRDLIDSMDLCDSCKPLVEEAILDAVGNVKKKEKGIDVKLAVDLVDSISSGSVLILISGDADFIPAMELAKSKDAEVLSASLSKGYSRQLRENFGFFVIGKNKIWESCLK